MGIEVLSHVLVCLNTNAHHNNRATLLRQQILKEEPISLSAVPLAERYLHPISLYIYLHNALYIQVKYNINKVQLKMLQITSQHAEQAVTVHCKNLAFKDRELMFHTMKSGSSIKPHSFSDGCSVSLNTSAFFTRLFSFCYDFNRWHLQLVPAVVSCLTPRDRGSFQSLTSACGWAHQVMKLWLWSLDLSASHARLH